MAMIKTGMNPDFEEPRSRDRDLGTKFEKNQPFLAQ